MNERNIWSLKLMFCFICGLGMGMIVSAIRKMPDSPNAAAPSSVVSLLDGKPMKPGSVHVAHGCFIDPYNQGGLSPVSALPFVLSDGSAPGVELIGGAQAYIVPGCGTLVVSVPSFYDNDVQDDDNTYYFKLWTPDKKAAGQ